MLKQPTYGDLFEYAFNNNESINLADNEETLKALINASTLDKYKTFLRIINNLKLSLSHFSIGYDYINNQYQFIYEIFSETHNMSLEKTTNFETIKTAFLYSPNLVNEIVYKVLSSVPYFEIIELSKGDL